MIWSDFKAAVMVDIPVDNQRIGIATGNPNYVDHQILYAIIKIQKLIKFYQKGHETVYGPADVVQEGWASAGALPAADQCRPYDAYYKRIGQQCASQPLTTYDWGNRYDLICGQPKITNCQFAIAFDPQGTQFLIFPALSNNSQMSLFWEGVKTSFDNADETPFEMDVAECVGLFVKSKIALMVDHDLAESNEYMRQYLQSRSLLFADTKDRSRMSATADSTSSSLNCANSINPCRDVGSAPCGSGLGTHEDTVEFCAFGDSSDTDMTNTNSVATLVKSLEPDFVMHLGDCNYPNGDPVTIQDNLVKPYGLYIPKKFYLSFGNHDIATDGGAALEALLTEQNALNSGKMYYDFIPGPTGRQYAHIFVLNGNDPNGVLDGSEQWLWLEPLLLASDMWNIVAVHQPPFCSDISHYPGTPALQRDWAAANAHLMIAGHGHNYERITMGIPLIICGLGGAPKRGFHTPPVTGSQFRYDGGYGSLYITARKYRLQTTFYSTNGEVIDSLALERQLATP